MRARSSVLLLTAVMVMSAVLVGRDEKFQTASAAEPAPPSPPASHVADVTPVVTAVGAPRAPAGQPGVAFDALETRMRQATEQSAAVGATISVAVLDRATRRLVTNGNTQTIPTASVAKLFIADDLLMNGSQQSTTTVAGVSQPTTDATTTTTTAVAPQLIGGLTAEDRADLDSMLRSSDDGAAQRFWDLNGGNAIISRVVARYGLTATSPPSDGEWWDTISTAPDLVRYYDLLLSGGGGLPADRANIIIGDLAQSTASGIDGYPQRFGIPEGLYAEPVAVKQGWMICIGNNWMHLSTGVVGPDRRYVVVIESMHPTDDATARATITRAVKTIFPDGRV